MVPSVKAADEMDFAQFWAGYEDLVRKARNNKLTLEDYAGTTISLTNPGGIGTVHSIPRLMKGQGTIIGVGAMTYPAEFAGSSPTTLARLGVSKVLTLTSTYDHRIIQGAASGEFLKIIETKLLGTDGFYDRVFTSLRVPYEPVRWMQDVEYSPENELGKPARIAEIIHAYRSRGHLIADTDPLAYRQRRHPDLDITNYGLTLWDLERQFPTGGFGNTARATLRDILNQLRDAYCRTVGIEYMHIADRAQRQWFQDRLERPYAKPSSEQQLQILKKLGAAEAFETFLQTKYVGQKRFSLEGGESLIPLLDVLLTGAAEEGMDESSRHCRRGPARRTPRSRRAGHAARGHRRPRRARTRADIWRPSSHRRSRRRHWRWAREHRRRRSGSGCSHPRARRSIAPRSRASACRSAGR